MRLASKKHISRVWLAQGAAASQCLVDPSRTSLWVIFGGFHNGGDKDDGGAVEYVTTSQWIFEARDHTQVNVGREAVMECKVNNLRSYKVGATHNMVMVMMAM